MIFACAVFASCGQGVDDGAALELASSEQGLSTRIFTPPNGFWIAPSTYTGKLYGPTSTNATWDVAQWSTPGNDLPPFANNVTANANQRAVWSGTSWEMAVSGKSLACDVEFDGFFGVNKTNVYPGYPAGGVNSAPLSTMTALRHTIGVTHKYLTTYDTSCANTSGNHLTAVVFKNTVTNATFFYQLRLHVLVGSDKNPNGNWWALGPSTWGFGDSLRTYGQTQGGLGQHKLYQLNVLPRITSLIQAKMPDKDLSHWVVSGTYHGTHVWGHLNATSVWDSFALTAE